MRRYTVAIALLLAMLAAVRSAPAQGVLNSLEKEIGALVDGIKPSLVTIEASDDGKHRLSWVGTGVVWSRDGKIVTTASLISDEDRITATLSDGRKLPATVLGIDDNYDLALLKVDAGDLPAVSLGNSDLAKPGSWATVIGNSYGMASSVTFGLVNGVREKDSLLQLSAGVAPGGTGGPVLNTQGEMIGLIHGRMSEPLELGPLRVYEKQRQKAITIRSDPLEMPSSETALAIPSNKIRSVCGDLEKYGTRKKGYLGVTISDLSEDDRKERKVASGLLVEGVAEDSPAGKAGMKDDDVILEFNGQRVGGVAEFRKLVGEGKPGVSVKVKVKRGGKDKTLTAVLGEAPGRSLRLRMKRLHVPDVGIDLPDIDIPQFDRLDMTELKQELKALKDDLRKMKDEFSKQMEKVKQEKRKVEKEKGL